MAKRRLTEAYRALGLALQEFDFQTIVRAHLGPGPIPVTDDEERSAAPFITTWAHTLERSARMYRQTYDYGVRAREIPTYPSEVRPPIPTPALRSLLSVMDEEGQTVHDAIDELDALHEAVHVLATHLRAVKSQSEFSAASMLSLARRTEDRGAATNQPIKLAA